MIQASTPEEVRKITQDVLARPEFRQTRTLTSIVLERVGRWIAEVSEWSAANPGVYKILFVTLTVILVALLSHIVYTLVREFKTLRERSAAEKGAGSMRALEGIAENWTDAFRLARAALEAGDLYRALWITHRILLSALDRMDRLKFARWKTNTDYLRECGGDDSRSRLLAEITAAYERVIYAHNDYDREQASRFLLQVESLADEAAR